MSFEKIRRVIGFEPEFTVEDGIQEVATAMASHPALLRYRDPVYHNVQALRRHLEERRTAVPALAGAATP